MEEERVMVLNVYIGIFAVSPNQLKSRDVQCCLQVSWDPD